MAVLCRGDKSGKLNYAWGLVDQDGDGALSRPELLFFFRAFLRMLLALSFEASSKPPAEVGSTGGGGLLGWRTFLSSKFYQDLLCNPALRLSLFDVLPIFSLSLSLRVLGAHVGMRLCMLPRCAGRLRAWPTGWPAPCARATAPRAASSPSTASRRGTTMASTRSRCAWRRGVCGGRHWCGASFVVFREVGKVVF